MKLAHENAKAFHDKCENKDYECVAEETVAQEQKDLRIKQITESLKYAQKSNVTKPQLQQTQDVTQETMFLLGTEALGSMVANEASRPLTLAQVITR